MTADFPPYKPADPTAGPVLPGRPMALHLLADTDRMLGGIPADVLAAYDVATLNLAAAQVHALLDVADAIRGRQPGRTPATLAELADVLGGNTAP